MENNSIVQMNNISKKFSNVKALNNVSFSVKKGEIRALIGENGAGKSTLMKILAGAYQKDEGEIIIDSKNTSKIPTPREMIDLGVSVIFQEFMLASDLTVAENIYIDNMSGSGMFINWKNLKRKTQEQLDRLGFGQIKPDDIVGELSVAYQQIVEIAKCLARNSKILVFDEPTAVLTFSETNKLLSLLKELKKDGITIIYISHRLEELIEVSDKITVLKDGEYVGTVNTSEVTKNQITTMMVGREIENLFPERSSKIGKQVLKVENLRAGDMVQDVSFTINEGEVVGFSGLVGSGRTESLLTVFGANKKDSGRITYFGREVNFKNPKEAIKSGFGLLPENRKEHGLLLDQSIRMNTTLSAMHAIKRFDIINHRKEKKYAGQLLESVFTKYGSLEDNASSLSGGNQQKIVIAKWLATNSKCIVFDEPTRGVDVGAKTEIYRVINQLAEAGVAIIMIASEMTEIIGLCDRAYVMRNGKVVGEVQKEDLNENNLINLSMGV